MSERTGGDSSPDPMPPPTPAPVTVPDPHGLLAEVAAMLREVAAGSGRELHEVIALLHSHGI